MTLKTEIMAAENSALPYRNILHFKIYIKRKNILNCNYILKIFILLYF